MKSLRVLFDNFPESHNWASSSESTSFPLKNWKLLLLSSEIKQSEKRRYKRFWMLHLLLWNSFFCLMLLDMDLGVLLPSLQSVSCLFSFWFQCRNCSCEFLFAFDQLLLNSFRDFRFTFWCFTSFTWPLPEKFSPGKLFAASFYQMALNFVTDAMVYLIWFTLSTIPESLWARKFISISFVNSISGLLALILLVAILGICAKLGIVSPLVSVVTRFRLYFYESECYMLYESDCNCFLTLIPLRCFVGGCG